jgi:hypothetical protein
LANSQINKYVSWFPKAVELWHARCNPQDREALVTAGAYGENGRSNLPTQVAQVQKNASGLEIEARMPSEVKAISPLVDLLIANPLSTENLEAERGRGLLLMCSQMDEVFLDSGGKQSPHAQGIPTSESRAVLD